MEKDAEKLALEGLIYKFTLKVKICDILTFKVCKPGADNAIHRINRSLADKCQQNVVCYPQDRDLSSE